MIPIDIKKYFKALIYWLRYERFEFESASYEICKKLKLLLLCTALHIKRQSTVNALAD